MTLPIQNEACIIGSVMLTTLHTHAVYVFDRTSAKHIISIPHTQTVALCGKLYSCLVPSGILKPTLMDSPSASRLKNFSCNDVTMLILSVIEYILNVLAFIYFCTSFQAIFFCFSSSCFCFNSSCTKNNMVHKNISITAPA